MVNKNSIGKPMLAATLKDILDIEYPVLATPKLDGIRCLIVNSKAVSRKFKPIPNNHIRKSIERVAIDGFDGEIIVKGCTFSEISSAVMSEEGSPDFTFKVFDYLIDIDEGYKDRMKRLSELKLVSSSIEYLLPIPIKNEGEMIKYENKCLSEGYEGVMLRSVDGGYKFGRSTLREGYLLKLKRFTDSEAVILGVYEQMSNQNEAEVDLLGHTKRSSCKDGKVSADTLGGFNVRDVKSGIEFKVGTGRELNDVLRKKIWNRRKEYVGKVIKYKHQESGRKEKPRFPVFLGFRDARDM